jgi:glycerol-3-phosphate dehydrogenase
MNRGSELKSIPNTSSKFDVLVIGGGATGLGIALDATLRGFRALLVEQGDFSSGTSSRSTKLIHGGIRYLRQLNISLVRESLLERARLLENAGSFANWRRFVIPVSGISDQLFYGLGLKLYDLLGGDSERKSGMISRSETISLLPGLSDHDFAGGVSYWDGQFDDAGLAIALASEVYKGGGSLLNYAKVESFIHENGKIFGAIVRDEESGDCFEVRSQVVVNATGVFADDLRTKSNPSTLPIIAASRGSHIVIPSRFLGKSTALMIPKTTDGRVLFAIPWMNRILVGTTDIPIENPCRTPSPEPKEISFLLDHINRFTRERVTRSHVLSAFAGLRPLVRTRRGRTSSAIPRDHLIETGPSGLVTVAGGKWTTYRKMAEDAIDHIIANGTLAKAPCKTRNHRIPLDHVSVESPALLHRDLPITRDHIRHAAVNTMARTVEDVLSRRTRCLLLDARASSEIASTVAIEMAGHLGRDQRWIDQQTTDFRALAEQHLCD